MIMQCPAERDMQLSASMKSSSVISPALTISEKRQTSVPEPMSLPRYLPFSIGPPETHDRRHVAARSAHEQRGRGLVAAGQQDHAVDRIAADRLLDVHRDQVAEQHRGRAQVALAGREDRELEREAARLVDAALDPLGQLAEMGVAGRELGQGVADADHRAGRRTDPPESPDSSSSCGAESRPCRDARTRRCCVTASWCRPCDVLPGDTGADLGRPWRATVL